MKVRNDDPSRLSSTERTVVNWLKSWTGSHALSGIAVVQAQGADLVVWTPKTCVVVVIKGFTERINGPLTVADAAPWTIEGRIAPLEGVRDGTEPMNEVRTRTTEIERVLRAAPGREHVAVMGIVLVIPQLGTRVSLDKSTLPPGLDVVVGDGPSSLRAYFARITGTDDGTGVPGPAAAGPDSWDAAQVSQALGALGFAAAATYSDLITEGFPSPRADGTAQRPAAEPARAAAPVAPIPAAAPLPPVSHTAAGTPPPPTAPVPPPARGPAPIPTPSGPPTAPPAQPAGRRSRNREFSSSASSHGRRQPEFASAAPGYSTPQRESASAAPAYAQRGYGAGQPSYPSPAQPYSVPFEPRPPKPPRRRGRGIVPLVILGILVLILAVAALCSRGGDDKPSSPAPVSTPAGSTAPQTAAPDVTIPSETPAPACYPLQPDCPAEGVAPGPFAPEPPAPAEPAPAEPAPADQFAPAE